MPRTSITEDNFASELKTLGLTFDRNVKSLPGTPDIVFNSKKLAVFFNGCFWHGHNCTNNSADFSWQAIQKDTQARDKNVRRKLQENGYETIVIWECEWKSNPEKIIRYINDRFTLARNL